MFFLLHVSPHFCFSAIILHHDLNAFPSCKKIQIRIVCHTDRYPAKGQSALIKLPLPLLPITFFQKSIKYRKIPKIDHFVLCAFLIGIGPAFPQIVPAVALGNAVLVVLWSLLAGKKDAAVGRYLCALAVAAVAKFLTLYLVIVKWLVPMVLTLNEKQTAVLSASFSFPQLITAAVGGVLAVLLVPPLRRALKV